jgi:hypothetical protein
MSYYWLVGASEGIGRALAKRLDAHGYSLVLSARNKERLEELKRELHNPRHLILPMDVTNTSKGQGQNAFFNDIEFEGVIYCAGHYAPIAIIFYLVFIPSPIPSLEYPYKVLKWANTLSTLHRIRLYPLLSFPFQKGISEKRTKGKTIVKLMFHLRIRQIVESLKKQDLHHLQRIIRRAANPLRHQNLPEFQRNYPPINYRIYSIKFTPPRRAFDQI